MTKTNKDEHLFRQAELKEEAGDFEAAFNLLRKAAQLGHSGAQVNLGNFYASGVGIEKNLDKAAEWYIKAYRQGDSSGANNLAIDLKNQGRTKEAILWFKRAVALRDGDAAVELAKLLKKQPGGTPAAIKHLRSVIGWGPSDITQDGKAKAKRMLRQLDPASSANRKPLAKTKS